ncbi:MAG: hypothetical protein M1559_02790 [Candidatus Marsarchaeota archaeon]|jgi:NADH:ubiquinone oxidoreductase subunit K|nr:hypothetical protein [Candidatus Marsarchaeota archaeon]MCL5434613.1 hypothetical protein [Candidatus Marsarchaeota archaeon]
MIPIYPILFAFAIFSIGAAGIATSRHMVIMVFAVEVVLVASALLGTVFYFYFVGSSSILPFLFAIWAIAASEAILLVIFYRYMVRADVSLDVTKLSRIKE